jgi:hypothetical protein
MRVHYIKVEQADKGQKAPRATLGGAPLVPAGEKWPECRLCKAPMIFFFQFDLPKTFDLPLKSGSHLLVFMCPVHNDVPTQLVESNEEQLPEEYWTKSFGHYWLMLHKPSKDERPMAVDKHIAARALQFDQSEEQIDWDGRMERGSTGFKVGGVPEWTGDMQYTRCACGAEMVFVCQVPPNFGFPKRKSAPVQPASITDENYNLFLGRPTFIFACKEQCTPYSLYAVTQDHLGDGLAESA